MSETQLMAKTPQLHPKQSIPMNYPKLTFKPIFRSLRATICFGPFYKFVAPDLVVIYQLKSLYLDDYNLTYSQNKNKVFEKKINSNSFETSPFPLYKNFSKPIQTNQNNQTQLRATPKTCLQPIQTPSSKKFGVFINPAQEKKS